MELVDEALKDKQTVQIIKQISNHLILSGSADECLAKKVAFYTKPNGVKKDFCTQTPINNCHGRETDIGSHCIKKEIRLRVAAYPQKSNEILIYYGFYGSHDDLDQFISGLAKSSIGKPLYVSHKHMPTYVKINDFLDKFIHEEHKNSYAGIYLKINPDDELHDCVAKAIDFYRKALFCEQAAKQLS